MEYVQGNPDDLDQGYLTQDQEAQLAQDSLVEKIRLIIDRLPPEGVSLSEIRDLFGQDGLLLLTVFLTIPFIIPVSIPGVSTVFGAAILLIGVSRFLGRTFWLPKKIEQRVLPTEKLRAGLDQGLKILQKLERLTRPRRMQKMTSQGLIGTLNTLSLIVGAVLLMAPFGFVPFSNTLPGLALLFLAIGLLQRDGLFIFLGHLVNVVTVTYFAFLIAGGTVFIQRVVHYFMGSPS
ncbi:MAG: exopolysaccharide biosynthesis protein [Candidatus Omnitrophica bacterium]|nr:exopolysaccharide biosynthesis protein [Candidatus Omnitrophota bacterium]